MKRFLIITSFVVILLVAVYFKLTNEGNLDNQLIDTARTISSFIFGVLFAYYLDSSNEKHKLIVSNLRKDDALMISIHQQVKYLDENTQIEFMRLLDNYLQSQIDFVLSDYYLSGKEFMKLYTYVQDIKTENIEAKEAKEKILSLLNSSLEVRKNVEANAYNKITPGEWITLFIFALIILLTTIGLYNGSLESIIVTALLSSGVIILLILLDRIDNLSWRQDEYIWLPLTLLFRDLGLLPYFPVNIVKHRKLRNIKGIIRVAKYPNQYPDCSGKIIEEVDIK